jgi:hypothetical protein
MLRIIEREFEKRRLQPDRFLQALDDAGFPVSAVGLDAVDNWGRKFEGHPCCAPLSRNLRLVRAKHLATILASR